MAKLFYKTVQAEPKLEKNPFQWRKLSRWMLTLALALLVLFFMGILISRVTGAWSEIMFAYHKPELIKAVREDYERKHRELDQSYLIKGASTEEKVAEEVVKRLQAQEEDLK